MCRAARRQDRKRPAAVQRRPEDRTGDDRAASRRRAEAYAPGTVEGVGRGQFRAHPLRVLPPGQGGRPADRLSGPESPVQKTAPSFRRQTAGAVAAAAGRGGGLSRRHRRREHADRGSQARRQVRTLPHGTPRRGNRTRLRALPLPAAQGGPRRQFRRGVGSHLEHGRGSLPFRGEE